MVYTFYGFYFYAGGVFMARVINTKTLEGSFVTADRWVGLLRQRKIKDLKNILVFAKVNSAGGVFTADVLVTARTGLTEFSTPIHSVPLPDDPVNPTFYTIRPVPIRIADTDAVRMVYESADIDVNYNVEITFTGSGDIDMTVEAGNA